MMRRHHDAVQNPSRTLNIIMLIKNLKRLSHDRDQDRTENICVLVRGFVRCDMGGGLRRNEQSSQRPFTRWAKWKFISLHVRINSAAALSPPSSLGLLLLGNCGLSPPALPRLACFTQLIFLSFFSF